ncbi:MAG: hypothetical protein WCT27_01320 [Patescibacteria group bacterium]|jgi:rubrerythrin
MQDSIEKLVNDCIEIKFMEIKAEQIYKTLLPYITDEKDRAVLQGIITDEQHHARIAQEMVDLLEAPE